MKAAVAALALACQLFAIGTVKADALSTDFNSPFAGAPIAPHAWNLNNAEYHHYAVSLNELAYQLILQGSFSEAEGRLKQALTFEPEYVSARCNLGYVLNRMGRASEALPHLQHAYRQAPNVPSIVQSLAAAYQMRGDFKSAVDLYELYLRQFPGADSVVIGDIVKQLKKESALFIAQNNGKSTTENADGTALPVSKNFNWNSRQIKVYVQAGKGLRGFRSEYDKILQDSFASWTRNGVVSFLFVDSADKADVECVWTDDARKLSSPSEGGEAVISKSAGRATHAKLVLLTNHAGASLSNRDVRVLCLHEIGHALGIMKHSSNPQDVMFCTLASADNPSAQDFQNLKYLYR